MIALLKWWKNRSNKDIDYSKDLERFRSILVEFKTRKVGKKFNETNILEYINSLFSIVQSLRDFLRDGEYDWIVNDNNNETTINTLTMNLCSDILNFQDKWNLSYTTWWSSFKHSSSYKKEIIKGRPFIFYDLQNYFDSINLLVEDIDILNMCINKYIDVLSMLYQNINSKIEDKSPINLNIKFVK